MVNERGVGVKLGRYREDWVNIEDRLVLEGSEAQLKDRKRIYMFLINSSVCRHKPFIVCLKSRV